MMQRQSRRDEDQRSSVQYENYLKSRPKLNRDCFFDGRLYFPLSFDHLFDYYPLYAIIVMYHTRKFFDIIRLKQLIDKSEGKLKFGEPRMRESPPLEFFGKIRLFYRHPCYSENREGKGKFEDLVKNMSRGVFVTGGLLYDYSSLNEKEKNYLELFFSIPSISYSFSFFEV